MTLDPDRFLTGYAGSSPPGPMIYWLGSRGGTPWDRLGGALPVNATKRHLLTCIIIGTHKGVRKTHHTQTFPVHEVCVPVEESRGVVLGAERLDVAVAPLEPSPSAAVTAVATEWSPPMPPTVLLMLWPMLGMLTRWLMLLLLLLLLWVEWSAEAEGCDDT